MEYRSFYNSDNLFNKNKWTAIPYRISPVLKFYIDKKDRENIYYGLRESGELRNEFFRTSYSLREVLKYCTMIIDGTFDPRDIDPREIDKDDGLLLKLCARYGDIRATMGMLYMGAQFNKVNRIHDLLYYAATDGNESPYNTFKLPDMFRRMGAEVSIEERREMVKFLISKGFTMKLTDSDNYGKIAKLGADIFILAYEASKGEEEWDPSIDALAGLNDIKILKYFENLHEPGHYERNEAWGGYWALSDALKNRNYEIVRHLLKMAPIAYARRTHYHNDPDRNAVYLLSSHKECFQEMRGLIMNGARISGKAAESACSSGNADAVSFFIYMGHRMSAMCMRRAVSSGSREIIKKLVANGCEFSAIDGKSIAKCLCVEGGAKIIEKLRDSYGLRTNNYVLGTIYHLIFHANAENISGALDCLLKDIPNSERLYFEHYAYSMSMIRNASEDIVWILYERLRVSGCTRVFEPRITPYCGNEYFE